MLGTTVNTCTIIIGSIAGAALKKRIRPEWQGVLYTAMGLASLALGFNAVCKNMPQSQYPVLFVVSLALGSLLGTMLNLAGKFDALVAKLKRKKPSAQSTATKTNNLAQGLSTGILLYCIGTLSILGPINSALLGDETFLFTNATLDLVTSAVLAATYGYGMVWAAPVLFCWQGAWYMTAKMFGDVIPSAMLCEMSIVGGTLIAASGLSILGIKDCKTLNLLPSLFVPVVFFLLKHLLESLAIW